MSPRISGITWRDEEQSIRRVAGATRPGPNIKPPCADASRRRRAPARARARATARSPPSARSPEWPRAGNGEIVPRSNTVSSAHFDKARRDAPAAARQARAISVPLPPMPALKAIATWKCRSESRIRLSDRLVKGMHRQAGTERAVRLYPKNTLIRFPSFSLCSGDEATAAKRKRKCKKMTRPDGEIRAGRFDRRRGSGGRERRSGL
jgi:hypothetical protein